VHLGLCVRLFTFFITNTKSIDSFKDLFVNVFKCLHFNISDTLYKVTAASESLMRKNGQSIIGTDDREVRTPPFIRSFLLSITLFLCSLLLIFVYFDKIFHLPLFHFFLPWFLFFLCHTQTFVYLLLIDTHLH
jgi:hypothetical protein